MFFFSFVLCCKEHHEHGTGYSDFCLNCFNSYWMILYLFYTGCADIASQVMPTTELHKEIYLGSLKAAGCEGGLVSKHYKSIDVRLNSLQC